MSRKDFYLVFVLHCERVTADAHGFPGADSLELSERAIRGMADYFEGQGLRCDFHPVPDMARAQRGLFLEMRERGFGIGMHFHCESWRDGSHQTPLGLLPESEQRRILSGAVDDYEQALGFRPRSYSAGNFSVSAETYGILADLGFTQSSSCLPERFIPKWGANWLGAFPFARRANRNSHLIPGELDLVEIPVGHHPWKRVDGVNPYDIRLDSARSEAGRVGRDLVMGESFYEDMVVSNFCRIVPAAWSMKSLGVFSHNRFDFGNPAVDQRKNLECVLTTARRQATEYNCSLVATTMELARQGMLRRAQADEGIVTTEFPSVL
jgi:hypothetical protein